MSLTDFYEAMKSTSSVGAYAVELISTPLDLKIASF
jgi:hypothetical protein